MTDRTILLVDNDPDEIQRLTQQLSPFGYRVENCAEIADIGDRIAALKPAVLLVRVDRDP